MANLNPYLTFPGNCEEAFSFYKSVFGQEYLHFGRYSEIPSDEEMMIPEDKMNKILHIALPVGKETILMGSDSGDEWNAEVVPGNNVSLSISTESREDADRIFDILSKEGKIIMQIGDVFWGSYYGICTDKFGVNWMVNFNEQEVKV